MLMEPVSAWNRGHARLDQAIKLLVEDVNLLKETVTVLLEAMRVFEKP
jgi:exonuclease VII small subunit